MYLADDREIEFIPVAGGAIYGIAQLPEWSDIFVGHGKKITKGYGQPLGNGGFGKSESSLFFISEVVSVNGFVAEYKPISSGFTSIDRAIAFVKSQASETVKIMGVEVPVIDGAVILSFTPNGWDFHQSIKGVTGRVFNVFSAKHISDIAVENWALNNGIWE